MRRGIEVRIRYAHRFLTTDNTEKERRTRRFATLRVVARGGATGSLRYGVRNSNEWAHVGAVDVLLDAASRDFGGVSGARYGVSIGPGTVSVDLDDVSVDLGGVSMNQGHVSIDRDTSRNDTDNVCVDWDTARINLESVSIDLGAARNDWDDVSVFNESDQ